MNDIPDIEQFYQITRPQLQLIIGSMIYIYTKLSEEKKLNLKCPYSPPINSTRTRTQLIPIVDCLSPISNQ